MRRCEAAIAGGERLDLGVEHAVIHGRAVPEGQLRPSSRAVGPVVERAAITQQDIFAQDGWGGQGVSHDRL